MTVMEGPAFTYHHAGISVPDLDAAIDWYHRVLGFELERRFDIEAAGAKAAFLKKDGMRIEVFQVEGAAALPAQRRHPPSDLQTHGNKHVAYQVADVDAFLADVSARGADVAFVVREDFGRGCFLRDCAGNLLEFVEG